MSSPHYSPFTKRLQKKLNEKFLYQLNAEEAMLVQRAFVEALKEEVVDRYKTQAETDKDEVTFLNPNLRKPLVIAGLGSFKMKTRPERTMVNQLPGSDGIQTITVKAGRRLVFTAKWEEIK